MTPVPAYEYHSGTVCVSGGTIPGKAAGYAMSFLEKGETDVDFICIGGNAQQQASKAMCSLGAMFDRSPLSQAGKFILAFRVRWVSVPARNFNGTFSNKDALVWTVLITENA